MSETRHRKYRQRDELYALIGRTAGDLETTRTTVIELAFTEFRARLKGDDAFRERMWVQAGKIDREKREAPLDARIRLGQARPREELERVGS